MPILVYGSATFSLCTYQLEVSDIRSSLKRCNALQLRLSKVVFGGFVLVLPFIFMHSPAISFRGRYVFALSVRPSVRDQICQRDI